MTVAIADVKTTTATEEAAIIIITIHHEDEGDEEVTMAIDDGDLLRLVVPMKGSVSFALLQINKIGKEISLNTVEKKVLKTMREAEDGVVAPNEMTGLRNSII